MLPFFLKSILCDVRMRSVSHRVTTRKCVHKATTLGDRSFPWKLEVPELAQKTLLLVKNGHFLRKTTAILFSLRASWIDCENKILFIPKWQRISFLRQILRPGRRTKTPPRPEQTQAKTRDSSSWCCLSKRAVPKVPGRELNPSFLLVRFAGLVRARIGCDELEVATRHPGWTPREVSINILLRDVCLRMREIKWRRFQNYCSCHFGKKRIGWRRWPVVHREVIVPPLWDSHCRSTCTCAAFITSMHYADWYSIQYAGREIFLVPVGWTGVKLDVYQACPCWIFVQAYLWYLDDCTMVSLQLRHCRDDFDLMLTDIR